jgi:hypothetical protein
LNNPSVVLIHGIFRSWNEFWISKFSPFRFESIVPAPRNVGVKGRHFGGTTGTRHPPQRRMSLVWE